MIRTASPSHKLYIRESLNGSSDCAYLLRSSLMDTPRRSRPTPRYSHSGAVRDRRRRRCRLCRQKILMSQWLTGKHHCLRCRDVTWSMKAGISPYSVVHKITLHLQLLLCYPWHVTTRIHGSVEGRQQTGSLKQVTYTCCADVGP